MLNLLSISIESCRLEGKLCESFLRGEEKQRLINLKVSTGMSGASRGVRMMIWLSTLGGGVNNSLPTTGPSSTWAQF